MISIEQVLWNMIYAPLSITSSHFKNCAPYPPKRVKFSIFIQYLGCSFMNTIILSRKVWLKMNPFVLRWRRIVQLNAKWHLNDALASLIMNLLTLVFDNGCFTSGKSCFHQHIKNQFLFQARTITKWYWSSVVPTPVFHLCLY